MQLQIDKEKLMSQLEACNRDPWKQPKKPATESFPPTWPAVPLSWMFQKNLTLRLLTTRILNQNT